MHKTAYNANGKSRLIHLGGWKRQAVDARDDNFRLKVPKGLTALPTSVDNRTYCSYVEDQGDLGSCTANMFAGLVEFNANKNGSKMVRSPSPLGAPRRAPKAVALPTVATSSVAVASDGSISFTTKVTPVKTPTPAPPSKITQVSRLFEYYATRKIQNTIAEDSGASIRDTIKAGVQYGIIDETSWPYIIDKFTVNPSNALWTEAASHKVTSYHAISDGDITTMKSTLVAGYLIGFGFNVYSYFMSSEMAKKGVLGLPGPKETLEGGHAVCLVGYDDSRKAFLVRNSWGTSWALGGYFWMAYDYVANTSLASDFWVVVSAKL